jgi:hypothetical protein
MQKLGQKIGSWVLLAYIRLELVPSVRHGNGSYPSGWVDILVRKTVPTASTRHRISERHEFEALLDIQIQIKFKFTAWVCALVIDQRFVCALVIDHW